jgi:hypothetical protein
MTFLVTLHGAVGAAEKIRGISAFPNRLGSRRLPKRGDMTNGNGSTRIFKKCPILHGFGGFEPISGNQNEVDRYQKRLGSKIVNFFGACGAGGISLKVTS